MREHAGEVRAEETASRVFTESEVHVRAAGAVLTGDLGVPEGVRGVVLFVHESGSVRRSAGDRLVARSLQARGFATLLLDLVTPDEERHAARAREHRFGVSLLSERLVAATDWLSEAVRSAPLPIGYFGVSHGKGVALVAAAARRDDVHAVVSWVGRPELAADALPWVCAPTRLIVGEGTEPVLTLDIRAMAAMRAPTRLELVPRSAHLFEAPGAVDKIAMLAGQWFEAHLGARTASLDSVGV
ncbi:MAG: hypothetical protein U0326_13585 [Polyangiales bacterium]